MEITVKPAGNRRIDTDEVGIYGFLKLDNNKSTEIIIEKDFPCKDRPEEDKRDTFQELADKNEKAKLC